MWIINRGPKGEWQRGIRKLSHEERQSLVDFYILRKKSIKVSAVARGLIGKIRDLEYWLECDCKKEEKPLMAPVRFGNGKVTFRRMTERYHHDKNCQFKEKKYVYKDNNRIIKSISVEKVLNLHMMNAESRGERCEKQSQTNGNGDRSCPKISRVLNTWIEGSGLNRIRWPLPDHKSQYQALREVAGKYLLAKGIPVKRFFKTFPQGIVDMALKLKDSMNMKEWPRSVRPYGLFVVVVNSFDVDKLYCGKDNEIVIRFEGLKKIYPGRIGKDTGSFIALLTATNSTKDPYFFVPKNVFLRPVFSKKLLFPVDSNFERIVLREIIRWMPWWKNKGKLITVQKPLFSLDQNESILPDFEIDVDEKRIFIEVMGSEEVDYQERKDDLLPLMEKMGKVLVFDAAKAKKMNDWEVRLNYLLRGISKEILENRHLENSTYLGGK